MTAALAIGGLTTDVPRSSHHITHHSTKNQQSHSTAEILQLFTHPAPAADRRAGKLRNPPRYILCTLPEQSLRYKHSNLYPNRPVTMRITTINRIRPRIPLGKYPQLLLCGHVGNAPTSSRITRTKSSVPIVVSLQVSYQQHNLFMRSLLMVTLRSCQHKPWDRSNYSSGHLSE